jgi:hypothetical protein
MPRLGLATIGAVGKKGGKILVKYLQNMLNNIAQSATK